MIMFPTHLSSSKYVNGGFSEGGYECFISLRSEVSDLMAEDESRTETNSTNNEEAGSTEMINHDDHDHGRWLQLSLGGGLHETTATNRHQVTAQPSVDFDLLLPGGSRGGANAACSLQHVLQPAAPITAPSQLIFQVPEFRGHHFPTSNTFFLQPHQGATSMNSVPTMTLQQHQQKETNYNYLQLIRPFPANMMTSPVLNPPVSSSSSFSGSSEQLHLRPVHVHRRLNVARVVNPPRRPHSGVWFMLQASQNQAKEPFLPQIPKSYLRIKDGRMTVGLLIKYLVNKLELGSESEIYRDNM